MFKGPFPSSRYSFPLFNEVQLSPFHPNYRADCAILPPDNTQAATAAAALPSHRHSAAAVTQQDSLHCSAECETLKGVCLRNRVDNEGLKVTGGDSGKCGMVREEGEKNEWKKKKAKPFLQMQTSKW